MILYFQAGKTRLAINTDDKTYSNDYWYLGGFRDYIKTSAFSLKEIHNKAVNDCYRLDSEHSSI